MKRRRRGMRRRFAVGVRSPRARLGAGIVRMQQLAVEVVHFSRSCSDQRSNRWGWLRGGGGWGGGGRACVDWQPTDE